MNLEGMARTKEDLERQQRAAPKGPHLKGGELRWTTIIHKWRNSKVETTCSGEKEKEKTIKRQKNINLHWPFPIPCREETRHRKEPSKGPHFCQQLQFLDRKGTEVIKQNPHRAQILQVKIFQLMKISNLNLPTNSHRKHSKIRSIEVTAVDIHKTTIEKGKTQ